MIPIDLTPEPEPPQAIKLAPIFDAALLGATVSLHGADRFAYSLKTLIGLTMLERQVQEPEARQIVFHEFIQPLDREHGPESPVWIDDTLLEEPAIVDDSPKIIVPVKVNGRRWKAP